MGKQTYTLQELDGESGFNPIVPGLQFLISLWSIVFERLFHWRKLASCREKLEGFTLFVTFDHLNDSSIIIIFFFHAITKVGMSDFSVTICGQPQRRRFAVHVANGYGANHFHFLSAWNNQEKHLRLECKWSKNRGEPTKNLNFFDMKCSQSSYNSAANTNGDVDSAAEKTSSLGAVALREWLRVCEY